MKKKKKEKTENMATLDDKLMGEKLHYYCSSSEDEDEPEPPPQGADGQPLQQPTPGKKYFCFVHPIFLSFCILVTLVA